MIIITCFVCFTLEFHLVKNYSILLDQVANPSSTCSAPYNYHSFSITDTSFEFTAYDQDDIPKENCRYKFEV